jgi:hypothetical protein
VVGGDSDLVSPTVSNSSHLLVLLLLLEQFQPLASRLGLGVNSSWELGEVVVSLLVSPSPQLGPYGEDIEAYSSVPENMSPVAYSPLRKSGM